MPDLKHLLRDLHAMHLRLQGLRQETDDGPRRLRVQKIKIEHCQKAHQDALDAVKHLKVAIHDKEVSLKETQQKVAKHRQQLNTAASKKEYDALRHEIDNETQAGRVLEDEILEAMGALEDKQKEVPALEKAAKEAQDLYLKIEGEQSGRQGELDRRLASALAELKVTEASLSGDLRALYDRQVRGRGADGLAPVRNRTCVGCNIELTPQGVNDLRAGRLIVCKNCGRLLYLEE